MPSDMAAARERTAGEDVIIKVIEVKTDSSGVNVAYTGKTISLEKAFQCGLIVASDYAKVLESQKTPQDAAADVSHCEPVHEVEPCAVNSLVSKCLSGNKSPISLRHAHTPRLSSPQLNAGGLNKRHDMEKLNVDAAVQCDLMNSSSTLIVLGSRQQYLGLVLPPAESFVDDKPSATTGFTSSLFSKKEKIAAFYIPQFSEVVDFDVAVQKGLIDSWTAELLKTAEIPDVVADDQLSEKFSSWLMYRKLRVDGCFHAAECLKVDSIPSLREAEQLFISYLVINSYIDAQTGKRVVILDRELSKMVKVFLEDPMISEDGEKQATSLDVCVNSPSERADKVYMNEDSDLEMEDEPQTCEPPYFVSSVDGRVSFRVEPSTGDHAVIHHPVVDVTEDSYVNVDESDPHAAENSVCLKNTDWARWGEFVQRIYRNDSHDDDGGSGKSSHQTLQHNTESICSELDVRDSFEAEFLHPEDLLDDEQDLMDVLEAHVGEEDVSDTPSVRQADVNVALSKNLMDKEAFLKLLTSQSRDTGSTQGDEWDSMSEFKENVCGGLSSSYRAYFLSEKQTISRSGCASISELLQADIAEEEFVVPDPETSVYPQGDFPRTSGSDALAFMDASGGEKPPTGRKTVVGGAAQDAEIEREITEGEVDYETGNVEEASHCLDRCLPTDGDHGARIFPHSLWSQVTAEGIRRTSKSSFPTDRRDSLGVSNSQATGAAEEGDDRESPDRRTFTVRADSDSPLFVEKVLISDSEVETRVSECESDASSRILAYEKSTRETERGVLHTHLRGEPTGCGCHSSTGVGSGIMSDSGTEDGTRGTSPQPAEDESEKVCCGEQKAGQRFPESSDDIIVPGRFESLTDAGSECEASPTAIRAAPEAELLDYDRAGSQCSSVNGGPSSSFSSERPHGNGFRIGSDREEVCFLKLPATSGDGAAAPGDTSSHRAETAARANSGCETRAETGGTAERASEHVLFCQTDLPDVPSDAPSGVPRVEKTHSDEVSGVRDPQTAEDAEGTRSVLSNTSKPGEKYAHKTDALQAHVESRHPDLLVDLLKRNAPHLESKEGGDPQQEGKVSEKPEEFSSVEQQLLCVLKTLTSSQDLSMVQEVMQSLNLALGSNAPEVQRHLDSIKEQSSEGEDEGSAEEDSPQSTASSGSRTVAQTEVCWIRPHLFLSKVA